MKQVVAFLRIPRLFSAFSPVRASSLAFLFFSHCEIVPDLELFYITRGREELGRLRGKEKPPERFGLPVG
jgi:hypothetical protein